MAATIQKPTSSKIESYLRHEHPVLWLALYHHVTHVGQRVTFKLHEYIRAIYMDESPEKVVKKSTQGGFSEWLIALTNAWAGLLGLSVFYILPNWTLHSRFVKNRYEQSAMKTPIYQAMVRAENEGNPMLKESLSLKKVGPGTVAFASSNSEAAFAEYPADGYIVDEWDLCDQKNLVMAEERLSHSTYRWKVKVGNPTLEDFGIDAEFANSDRKQWAQKCPHCGHWIFPDWFQNVVKEVGSGLYLLRDESWTREMKRDVFPICDRCGKPYERYSPGVWVRYQQHNVSGYEVSKLFSSLVPYREIMLRFEKGLTNDFWLQRFYNGDLGKAYTSKGAKIDRAMLNECRGDYSLPEGSTNPCAIGIDVGQPFMHVIIAEILPGAVRVVFIGTVREPEDLRDLSKRFNICAGVIDAMPETRMSRGVSRMLKNCYICYYGGVKGETVNPRKRMITADRTQALDAVKESVLEGTLQLPGNADQLPDFYDQMTASVRVFDEEKGTYSWTEGNRADHYHHAVCYALLARRIMSLMRK